MSTHDDQIKHRASPKYAETYRRRWESPKGRAVLIRACLRQRVRKTGREMTLPIEWFFVRLKAGICEMSGLSFDLSKHNKGCPQFYSPSVDRIDNSKGYTIENSRMVLDGYNRGKGVATDNNMKILAKAILGEYSWQN